MTRQVWCVLVAGVMLAGAARAQVPDPAREAPGLATYVREVLARNGGLHAAAARLAASAEAIAPAGALPDPMLSIAAMAVPTPSFDLRAEGMTQVPAIALEQRFPFPGKQGASAAVARAERAVVSEQLGGTEAALAATAAGAYWQLAYARTALDTWRARVTLADQAVRASEVRYATGAAPQTDALRARLRRAQLSEEGHQLDADLAGAAARADALRTGPGTPVETPLLVGAAGDPAIDPSRETLAPDSTWLLRVATRGPAPRVARAEAERADRGARSSGIAARPDFVLSLQYGTRFAGREPFLSGMLGVSLPLWAGRKQGPAAAASRFEARAAQQQYEDVLARERGDVAAVLAELRGLHARIAVTAGEILPLARAASASALQRYQVGDVELTAVLDTQDDLFRAQLAFGRLAASYGAARARLAALVGEEWYR